MQQITNTAAKEIWHCSICINQFKYEARREHPLLGNHGKSLPLKGQGKSQWQTKGEHRGREERKQERKTRRNKREIVSKRGTWERWPCVLVYPGQSQFVVSSSCNYEEGPLSLSKGPGLDDTLHERGHRPISQPSFHPVVCANIPSFPHASLATASWESAQKH